MPVPRVVVDFDGTITEIDGLHLVLLEFGDRGVYEEHESRLGRDLTLREVITGLPVAGFTGSLQERFDQGPAAARGRVLAKTGTLTGVHGLAGVATDLDGDLLGFVMIADRVAVPNTLPARHDLDLMAAALGACHCGGPNDSAASP